MKYSLFHTLCEAIGVSSLEVPIPGIVRSKNLWDARILFSPCLYVCVCASCFGLRLCDERWVEKRRGIRRLRVVEEQSLAQGHS